MFASITTLISSHLTSLERKQVSQNWNTHTHSLRSILSEWTLPSFAAQPEVSGRYKITGLRKPQIVLHETMERNRNQWK